MKKLVAPLAAVLLIGPVGCSSFGDDRTDDRTAAQDVSAEPLSRDVKFGQTARVSYDSSEFAVTVSAPVDYTEFAVPPVAGKYVAIHVEAELIDGIGGAVSAATFTLVDGAGNNYTFAAPSGTDTREQMFSTLLSVGDSGSGIVVFDVPVDPGKVVVKFIPVAETKDFASWS